MVLSMSPIMLQLIFFVMLLQFLSLSPGRLHLIHCWRNRRRLSQLCTTQLCHPRHLASFSLQRMHCHRSSWQCAAGRLFSVVLSYVVRVLVHKDYTAGWGRPCFSWWSVQERIVEFSWLSALLILCLFVCRYIHFSQDCLCWCSRWFLSTMSWKHSFCSGGLH